MSKKGRTEDLESIAPPLDPLDNLQRSTIQSVCDELDGGSTRAIIAKQKEKAIEDGDTKAARFLMQTLYAFVKPALQAPKQQIGPNDKVLVNVAAPAQQDERVNNLLLSELRERIVSVIYMIGRPVTSAELERATKATLADVCVALCDHPWFDRTQEGWGITTLARKEVLALLPNKTDAAQP